MLTKNEENNLLKTCMWVSSKQNNKMNLLPKTREEFSKEEYWNAFFKKRGTRAFEWYGEYPELCGHLHKYIKTPDTVLVMGCGNSKLSADLYDVGYRNLVNIDISATVIKQMQQLHSETRSDMKFIQMDALAMTFEDTSFSVVLDKGTLDALMPNDSSEVRNRIQAMFKEINRVLKMAGRWVCVSLLQDHVLNAILNYFPVQGWMVRICRCTEAEERGSNNGESSGLPVFVVVCTKMMKMPNSLPVLELLLSSNCKAERLASSVALANAVKQVQQSALLCSRLSSSNIASDGEVSLDLLRPGDVTPRFTLYIRDKPCVKEVSRKFAAFIVPQGRETEWLFATSEGRESLHSSVGFDRLAIITMSRDHTYTNLEEVKEEVTECVLKVAPLGYSSKIPFLSVGDDVGTRKICLRDISSISGDVIVEEVEGEGGELFRRLIFLKNPNVIQSECKLKKVKSRKGVVKYVVDTTYLGCDHHIYMSAGVCLVQRENPKCRILVIGLGGGGLCTYLHSCFKDINITAVDIDPLMEKIARDFFGLPSEERLSLRFEDGISFLKSCAQTGVRYDAVLFDIDNKDASLGMSCPPKEFLDLEVLEAVKKCVDGKGIFILNLVCRSEALRKDAIFQVKKRFLNVCSYKLIEDVNEVVYCSNRTLDQVSCLSEIEVAAKFLNEVVKEKKIQRKNVLDVADMMTKLKLN